MTVSSASALTDQAALTQLLNRFLKMATTSTDARETTEWALREVADLTGWPVSHVMLIDAHGCVTTWFSTRENQDRWLAYTVSADKIAMRTPTGLLDRVISTRRPGWVPDLRTEVDYPRGRAARDAGLYGVFAFPVIRNNTVVSVLQFLSEEPITPDREFLDTMTILGFLLGASSERHRALDEQTDGPSRLHHILDSGGATVMMIDTDGRIQEWNQDAERLFGWTREEALHRKVARLIMPPQTRRVLHELLVQVQATGRTTVGRHQREVDLMRRDGSIFPAEVVGWVLADGPAVSYCVVIRDITSRMEERQGVVRDELTGLANRSTLVERLTARVRSFDADHADAGRAQPGRAQPALVSIRIAKFKELDSTPGHQTAERALVICAERLACLAGPNDLVARVVGEEFALLVDDVRAPGGPAALARCIIDTLATPFETSGRRIALNTYVGVALVTPGSDADSVLGDADASMVRARQSGRESFTIYGNGTSVETSWRRHDPADLEAALRAGQFQLFYQPVFAIPDRRIVGAEALIRWRHPKYGLLLPGEFIDLAEGSGLIAPIGEWVLAEAATQLRKWHGAAGATGFQLAVNLSARQLADPNIIDQVAAAASSAGLATSNVELTLEVTESVLIADPKTAAMRLREFRNLGVKIAIDDFGTGYSSLAYLKSFDVDMIKIDQSFVDGMVRDRTDRAIVSAVLELARELDLEVIAEGVETEEQLQMLGDLGCNRVQGFLLSEPQPAQQLTDALAQSNGVVSS